MLASQSWSVDVRGDNVIGSHSQNTALKLSSFGMRFKGLSSDFTARILLPVRAVTAGQMLMRQVS